MVNAKAYKTEKRFINADEVRNELIGKKLTIDAAFNETINEKDKLCIRFSGVKKILALNQTNIDILSTVYGDDTDKWINNKVTLSIVKVKFNGELVDSVQVVTA